MEVESKMEDKRQTILITGFGPFGDYKINASWEAVKELLNWREDLETEYGIKIVAYEVPVAYKEVSDLVPKFWMQHNPLFVIHVGVSGGATFLTLESTAHGSGYTKPDINDLPPEETELQEVVLHPDIDVKQVSKFLNDHFDETQCKAVVSHNAGRYLCEYIFYKSLSIDTSRVLFIHVPDLKVYTAEQSAKGLKFIIRHLMEFLKQKEQKENEIVESSS